MYLKQKGIVLFVKLCRKNTDILKSLNIDSSKCVIIGKSIIQA